ncbi:MAG: DUF3883 domain-containing protein [Acidobacteria bacterium]|jgi:hypothetical protein|nr:DUF3883 domain-containing protein [Tatlockia sp.]MBA4121172.1 DUF3883 domain-containing protein [Acidobacteriota bacterium]
MIENSWKQEVRTWVLKRRNLTPNLAEAVVEFFVRAFENTRYPKQAWFGIHNSHVSLVIGGIFLAAISSSGDIWLLADEYPIPLNGLDYSPVASTQRYKTPLVWIHGQKLDDVTTIIEENQIWQSYALASEKIFNSPISRNRDESFQIKHRKRRLSDFWNVYTANVIEQPLLEIEQKYRSYKAGAGFGNPETNRKVENAATSFVRKWYEERGWSVQSVEAEKCGYDLRCINDGLEEHVEVKGVQGEIPSFIITAGEVRQSKNNALFKICVVTCALSNQPKLFCYGGNEFANKFNLDPISFKASLRL